MLVLHSSQIPLAIPNWAHQLATLTRSAWTGKDGRCYFPYRPLTTPEYWETTVAPLWDQGQMHSWVLVIDGRIVAHSALVKKPTYWELGRWVAFQNAPRGAVTQLCTKVMEMVRAQGLQVQVECTQAHIHSQSICERLGLRPAGFGILEHSADGTWWDIIYYDNADRPAFDPDQFIDPSVVGDPLGQLVRAHNGHLGRLQSIPDIISTQPSEGLPPQQFHILSHRRDVLERTLARVLGNLMD